MQGKYLTKLGMLVDNAHRYTSY